MKRITFLFLVLSLVYTSQPALAQSPQRGLAVTPTQVKAASWGNYYALIIGINDYAKWPRLQTAVKDATVIRDTLITNYGFDPQNVILRTDKEASRIRITGDLRYLALSMSQNDNLLVYYAGHGQLDDFTGDGYWVPAEGALKDPATWVANSYIKAVLSSEKLQAKNVVVIADSCYSGSMLRGGPSLMSLEDQRYKEKLVQKSALRSRQVISSGGVEPVADGGADGHSLFAYYLITALRNNDREVIDLENLFHTRVWEKVTQIGDQRPNVGRLKTPMDQDGQFVLYNAAWAEKQAHKQAVVEAQKQEQARMKETVMSAELELQRQRIEMEKQRLALEREQLAQQKALEMERLELERQKQEIETAKLQARLEEAERQRKVANQQSADAENAELRARLEALERKRAAAEQPTMVAAVDKRADSRQTLRNRYKLALFPIKVHMPYGGREGNYVIVSIDAITRMAAENQNVDLTTTFRKQKGMPSTVKLMSDKLEQNEIDIWKRASLFSKAEPDREHLKKASLKLGVDLAVTISSNYDEQGANIDIYVYDSLSDKLFKEQVRADSWVRSGTVIETATYEIIKKLYQDIQ